MKKSWLFASLLALASVSALAQDATPAAAPGKMLLASDGARLGAVYRVTDDGSAQLIIDGKMVEIPAATLAVVDGKLKTSLSKSEVRKLR